MCTAEEADIHLDEWAPSQLRGPGLQSQMPCDAPRARQVTAPPTQLSILCHVHLTLQH